MKGAIEFYVLMIFGVLLCIMTVQFMGVFSLMQRAAMERDRVVSIIEEFNEYSLEAQELIQQDSLCLSFELKVSQDTNHLLVVKVSVDVSVPLIFWENHLVFMSFPNIS